MRSILLCSLINLLYCELGVLHSYTHSPIN